MADIFGSLAPSGKAPLTDTPLGPFEEAAYRAWVQANRVPTNPNATGQDYDMRGFWQALQQGNPQAQSAIDQNDNRMHYPDYWKAPTHPMFSNQSQWGGPDSPQWTPDDKRVDISGRVLYNDRRKPEPGSFGALVPGWLP